MQVFTYICQNFKTMKTNELRLGNLIDRQDYICKVTRIEEDGIITEPLEYKGERFVEQKLKPIPLTEEWLVKFGFVKDSYFEIYYFKDYCVYIEGGQFNFMNDAISNGSCYYLTTIKYVHQLQNLCFALVGEELTIG